MTTDDRTSGRDSILSKPVSALIDCCSRFITRTSQWRQLSEQSKLDEARALRQTIENINWNLHRIVEGFEMLTTCRHNLVDVAEEKIAPVLNEIAEGVWS